MCLIEEDFFVLLKCNFLVSIVNDFIKGYNDVDVDNNEFRGFIYDIKDMDV